MTTVFDYLIYAAIGLYGLGLLLLVIDALSGYRFIARYPFLGDALAKIGKPIWIAIGAVLAFALVFGDSPSYDEDCVIDRTRDGMEVIC